MKTYPETSEQRHSRNRENLKAAVMVGAIGLVYWKASPLLIPLLVFWIAPIVVAEHLGKARDRTGWMWGMFLGWLGVLILACMRSQPQNSDA